LQHVPIDVEKETKLDPQVASWLAFADQKVEEVVALAKGLEEGDEAIEAELAASDAAVESRQSHPGVRRAEVRERTAAVTAADRERA
ncbi:5-methyltetrahydropteroyltriglutamate--homocysteine S-methyltransferase, partial [Actinomyces urogenitalis]|nr:5-methyltetrahydropteroyltriglutamate--homocysteine S-methyltransferase [Actinomyces urogenitalis]